MAFFFPGQGAQTVGMGKEVAESVPAAKQLFERASDILGYDLLAVCGEGEMRLLFLRRGFRIVALAAHGASRRRLGLAG